MRVFPIRFVTVVIAISFCFHSARADDPVTVSGVSGGLCVQLGASDLTLATDLARTGRFLVHVLDEDDKTIAAAQQQLYSQNLYGLVSIDHPDAEGKLPYAENLVNLLLIAQRPQSGVSLDELKRVLCPRGVVLVAPEVLSDEQLQSAGFADVRVVEASRTWLTGRKPWPAEMDVWSHPRHSASGNAVSSDTIVGPPRRIRWLAGPWQEVSSMVSADGRNYYGGLITRDSFNGLRLWEKSITPSPANGGFGFHSTPGSVSPVAGDGRLFVVTDGKLQALSGSTGETLQEYSEAGKPLHVLYDDGMLITVGGGDVKGIEAQSGRLLWTHQASEPRFVVVGDDTVGLMQGNVRRGEKSVVVALDKRSGKVRWTREDFPWAANATRSVYYQGMLTFEVSTLNDGGAGNAIHILTADDGTVRLDHDFLPGANHMRQARAMYIDNTLWLLHGGKDADNKRHPTEISAIDYLTGKVRATHPAGLVHCFPPVATSNFFFSGEMDLTDLRNGQLDANQITKAACGRDSGWIPANGLIYVAPKHCVCWPMLRGYAALAAARPGGSPALKDVHEIEFPLEVGQAFAPPDQQEAHTADDWPCYRHDGWRSGSTLASGPSQAQTLWSVDLGGNSVEVSPGDSNEDASTGGAQRLPTGPILEDWNDDPFVKGPITPPVIAGNMVYVARPNAHEVVALDDTTGQIRWRFSANGRVDTPPTIHRGLCLFGCKSGWVYCLRADNGQLVWRLRAAPLDERIVAYGGLESPWPVPGSVLVIDDVAYFAAGRQSLADGGILVFAVDPATGRRYWVSRLDSIPQKGFYESSGLEFDNFDLLFQQGDSVAMSRWVFEQKTGKMQVNRWDAFARLNTGGGSVMAPQGYWSYAPRNQKRTKTLAAHRPLVVFRDSVLFGCLESQQSIYRRDFDLEGGEKFDTHWITGWANGQGSQTEGGLAWRSQRLAEKAKWSVDVFDPKIDNQQIAAMALAGDKLYLAGSGGELRIISTTDGQLLAKQDIPVPLWDGLAISHGRLFVSTQDGQLRCLGETVASR